MVFHKIKIEIKFEFNGYSIYFGFFSPSSEVYTKTEKRLFAECSRVFYEDKSMMYDENKHHILYTRRISISI